MYRFANVLATANESGDGSAFFGFLIIAGVAWLLVKLNKPKGYDIDVHSKGRIRPR